jgi:hypothetical protein
MDLSPFGSSGKGAIGWFIALSCCEACIVLAAVKDAARRLRRWPFGHP